MIELLIVIAIIVIMTAILLTNKSNKGATEVQAATRTIDAQLRSLQNDAQNGKVVNGKSICKAAMLFENTAGSPKYYIQYYDDCTVNGLPINNTKTSKGDDFIPIKSTLQTSGTISFLTPMGKAEVALDVSAKGVLLASSNDPTQLMTLCVNDAGNITETNGNIAADCDAAALILPVTPTCDCTGKTCGDNGCGGSCGTCTFPQTCNVALGTCSCTPNCTGKTCGDDGCSGTCGNCTLPQTCNVALGTCCTPSCTGKTCGDDGCGGSCGTCAAGACVAGACLTNKTYICADKPTVATVWNSVNHYNQTWNGSAWTPPDSSTTYNTKANTSSCRFKCLSSHYVYGGGVCYAQPIYATGGTGADGDLFMSGGYISLTSEKQYKTITLSNTTIKTNGWYLLFQGGAFAGSQIIQ